MTTHARLSASSASRFIACPGSIALVEQLELEGAIAFNRSGPAAAEGTAAHYLAELCLTELVRNGVWDISAEEYLGDTILVDPENGDTELVRKPPKDLLGCVAYTIDADMVEAVNTHIQHVRGVLESMGSSYRGIPEDVTVDLERKMDLSHLANSDHLGGTVDVRISQAFGELHIIDYKHGRGIPVDPTDNPQLQYYALGSDISAEDCPESVHLTIVQPRCPKVPSPVQTWVTTPDALRSWAESQLLPAVASALSEDPPRATGESQCRWCRAVAHCPEVRELSLRVAQDDFAESVPELPDEDFVDLFSKVALLRTAAKALETRAVADLQSGKPLPGYKLVEKRTKRAWVKGAEEALLARRVPKKHLYTQKLVPYTQLEKIKKYAPLVDELTTRPTGALEVAKESDKRPAVSNSAELDFDILD